MAVPRCWDCEVIEMLSVKESDLPKKYRAQVRNKLKSQTQRQQVSFQDRIDAAFEKENKTKYCSTSITIDGHTFPSRKEADFYSELKIRERAGEISDLVLQPRFLLQDSFEYHGKVYSKMEYVADFQYVENGRIVVVDTKGFVTDVYRLKKKLFLYKYGSLYEFLEVH